MQIENNHNGDSRIMYIHILVSLCFVPFLIQETTSVRILAVIYASFLVLGRKAIALPALCILSSYLPNTYIIYFMIIVLSIRNIKVFQIYKVLNLFMILLLILPVVIFYIYISTASGKMSPGNAINQFQYYFSLFAFFYGILIYKTLNRTVFVGLFVVFVILHGFNVVDDLIIRGKINRLFFYIVPYLLVLWLSYFSAILQPKKILPFTIIGILIVTTLDFDDSTFTILLSGLFAGLIYLLVKNRLTRLLKVIISLPIFVGTIAIIIFTIINTSLVEFDNNLVNMSDINSYTDLFTRFSQKWFVDRGALWAGAWQDIVMRESYMPSSISDNIILQIDGNEKEFGFHSHNIFLDLIRNNGYIIGVILLLVFIRFNILGAKILLLDIRENFILMMFIVAFAGNLIGGLTGVFVLLNSYALLGIGLMGIGHAYSTNLFNKLSSKSLK